jgi:tetraacyldisaccharide 4'-kinase
VRFLWRTDEPFWMEAALAPLSAASWVWAAASSLRRPRPFRASVPTLSVGNVVAGGAGKTPVAMEIARRLLARGRRTAVLSRGYGRSGKSDLTVDEATPWDQSGDEPALIRARLATALVLVGNRRAAIARRAVEMGADALVLDDGLQHLSLARDLDVIAMDASNPLGNGRLIPRGPLREMPASAFARAGSGGLLWLTRCDLPRDPRTSALIDLARDAGLAGPVESAFATRAQLGGRNAFLFAGVARPESFEALVRSSGALIAGTRWFGDHHRYGKGDLQQLRIAAAARGAAALLTTEKDLVRIALADRAGPPPIEAVPVDLRILSGEEALSSALDRALAPRS